MRRREEKFGKGCFLNVFVCFTVHVCVCVCKRKRGNPKDDSYVIEDNNKEEVNNKGEE